MDAKEIDPTSFCSLHHFFASYMQRNMHLPGQVEKWFIITNINSYPLTKLPLSMFKASNKELGTNWVDCSAKSFLVNLTWIQTKAANFFVSFLDPVTKNKQVFCDKADTELLDEFIYKSQRPVQYGGTAPNVTKYWPPIMPPLTD